MKPLLRYWYSVELCNPVINAALTKMRMGTIEAEDPIDAMTRIEEESKSAYPGHNVTGCKIHEIDPSSGKCEEPCLMIGSSVTDHTSYGVRSVQTTKETKKDDGQSSHECEKRTLYTPDPKLKWSTPVPNPQSVVSMTLKETNNAKS